MSSFAMVHSRALLGMDAPPVSVEVHLSNGLPGFTLVGLADTEVKEARERVRSALLNSNLQFPSNKRIIVNLAPADLPKDSGRFDLAIAIGILAANGQIDKAKLNQYEFAGELSLNGNLRAVKGALAMGIASLRPGHDSQKKGYPPRALVLPLENAQEVVLVEEKTVYGATHLLEVIAQLVYEPDTPPWQPLTKDSQMTMVQYPDMADVKGQIAAKRALEIAATGGHSVLMLGAPGTGKSMLAHRFVGLLPPMQAWEALESAGIQSLSGKFVLHTWKQRPTRSPHHSASAVALVGGGSPPKPGEISLAHRGVLFLDEFPEFPRHALEALREPLETGIIRIARASHQAEFPADFQLICAMNPCPCGYFGSHVKPCRCKPEQVIRYQNKISGPLLDRIDIHIEVPMLPTNELLNTPQSESSTKIQKRVYRARKYAYKRQKKTNNALQSQELDNYVKLNTDSYQFLQSAVQKLGWSARATHRVMRIARTIADLELQSEVQTTHLAEAIQYRRGLLHHQQ
jgi:magnesium chelatase family protein